MPLTAKVALGSTARPYLNNHSEAGSLTAVISSIGQIPSPRFESPAVTQDASATQFETAPSANHIPLERTLKEAVTADTPIQTIATLSESNENDPYAATTSSIQSQNSHPTPIEEVGHSQNLAPSGEVIAIEYLSLANPLSPQALRMPLLTDVTTTSVRLAQSASNDEFNLSGLGGLVSLAPIATVTSLGTALAPESRSNVSVLFEGITVSGQADSLDFLMAVGSIQNINTPSFGQPITSVLASETTPVALGEEASSSFTLHSIILISVPASSADEGFGI